MEFIPAGGDLGGEVRLGLLLEAFPEVGGLEEGPAVEEGHDLVHALAKVLAGR